jgi:H+/Cl- antiporter ClcA
MDSSYQNAFAILKLIFLGVLLGILGYLVLKLFSFDSAVGSFMPK